MKKRVTMRDIGAALGVSTVTISKALGGKEGVSDAVRARILEAAEEMGYQYVAPAVEMHESNNEIIGILTREQFFDNTSFYACMYREMTRYLLESGMLGVLEIIPKARENEMPNVIQDRRVSGLILMGQFPATAVDMVAEAGLPAVLLDFYSEHVDSDAVVSDGQGGGYLLTQELIEAGHRRIAFVGSIEKTTSIMDRYDGYLRALVLSNISPRQDWLIPDRDDDGRYLLTLPLPEEMPTAFVCNNDEVAYRIIRQLRKRGLRVPEDVSVTGFDDFLRHENKEPFVTTYRVDVERMAQMTVQRLRQRIRDGSEGPIRMVVGGWLIRRDTIAPPPN